MASGNHQIALNGRELWAYVVELAEGLRIQLSIDDWERTGLVEGQRISCGWSRRVTTLRFRHRRAAPAGPDSRAWRSVCSSFAAGNSETTPGCGNALDQALARRLPAVELVTAGGPGVPALAASYARSRRIHLSVITPDYLSPRRGASCAVVAVTSLSLSPRTFS